MKWLKRKGVEKYEMKDRLAISNESW